MPDRSHLENLYIHGFNLLPQFGPRRLMLLANGFSGFEAAYKAPKAKLLRAGLSVELAGIFDKHRDTTDLNEEAHLLEKLNIRLLSFKDERYPKLLLEAPDFPPLLYVKGKMDTAEELMLAVVGTRKITGYGRAVTPQLVEPLAREGVTIVSGLAYGVDAAAHRAAISCGGRTIAVLGCGLDAKSLYPQDHVYLADQIIENNGALVSEHPPGRPALKQNFVARNRIISGMSAGTLIIECGTKSGALITARHALEQNRQVFAVPGPIYSSESSGPNNLLKMGARCATEAADILSDLNIKPKSVRLPEKQNFDATPEEKKILELMDFQPISIHDLVKRSGMEAGAVGASLTFLEMKGRIRNLGGQQYILARKI